MKVTVLLILFIVCSICGHLSKPISQQIHVSSNFEQNHSYISASNTISIMWICEVDHKMIQFDWNHIWKTKPRVGPSRSFSPITTAGWFSILWLMFALWCIMSKTTHMYSFCPPRHNVFSNRHIILFGNKLIQTLNICTISIFRFWNPNFWLMIH